MKKKFTMLFVALLACVGVMAQDQVVGLKKIPETCVDLAQGLETGYYLLKQVNDAADCAGGNGVGWIKASSEAASVSATSVGTGTPGEDGALYIWYVEVVDAENRLIKISTANKVASWYLPENSQREKKLIAYADATTLQYHHETCVDLGQGANTPKVGSAFISNSPVTSYIHFSGNNLGSWNSSGTNSTYMVEFYAIPTEDLIVYGPVAVAKMELESYIAEASAGLGSIALQTSDAKAAGYLSSCGSADGNVEKNMIDGNNGTFYGSPWLASVANVDYHYWQVDLGDGVSLNEFVFSYVTRANGEDTPYSIVVKGSADGETFNELANIAEGLPQTASASYTSSSISNLSNYRYIRFDVTDARKGSGNNPGYAAGGHATQKTFAIAEFALINKDEASWSEQDKAIKVAIDAAQKVLDADDATVETIAEALHNVKMAEMVRPVYPFTVTTDDETPVLYAIKSGRTNEGKEWWYTYDATDDMIALSQYTGANEQMWFFKEVVTEDYQYALQLYPYAAPTKAMSYEDTNSDPAKIAAKEVGTEDWINLWLSVSTDGAAPYGLQTYNKANYLSNNGGVTNKMGMWNAAPSADPGTAMYFVTPAEALQALIDKGKGLAGAGVADALGCYTSASIDNLNAAIAVAEANLANKNYSVTELNAAIAAMEIVLPEAGYYFIKGTGVGNEANWYATYGSNNSDFVAAATETLGAKHVWKFEACEDGYKLQSCNLGKYAKLDAAGATSQLASDFNAGAKFVLTSDGSGKFTLKDGNNNVMRTEGSGAINHWMWNGTTNENESWYLVPVTELEISINEFASICLPFDVEVEGATAYAVTETATETVTLTEKADIPAGEGAILEGNGTAKLVLATAASDWSDNLLEGTTVETEVEGKSYILANGDNGIGLYNVTLTDGKFTNGANKAYLSASKVANAAAAMFSFGRGEGTTGIETAVSGEQAVVIYDLAGRRVEKMEKGIYIVNGKKVVK